jgi:hypothetical protein
VAVPETRTTPSRKQGRPSFPRSLGRRGEIGKRLRGGKQPFRNALRKAVWLCENRISRSLQATLIVKCFLKRKELEYGGE